MTNYTDHPEVSLLRGMLEIYSPSMEERRVAEYLREQMAASGISARIDEAGNVVGEVGDADGDEVVLLGHIDTVSGFIPVEIRDGRMFGRGAVDAKGPMGAFVSAMARLSRSPERLAGKHVVVIGAVEEEAATSKGARYVVEKHNPVCAIIGEPSGWSGVTLGYKGRLLVDFSHRRVARHSAIPGKYTCEEAVDFWNGVSAHVENQNRGKKFFERVDASLRRINSSGDGFEEIVDGVIALRLPVDCDIPALKETIGGLAGEVKANFRGEENAIRTDKNSHLVRAFLSAIRERGGEPAFKLKSGTSDMNVVGRNWNCQMVAYGPGDSSLDHTPGEAIDLAEYLRAIDVLERVLSSCDPR